ncbi:hypothetical protein DNL40_15480 [Xylanimonas oleitrophica]|uniref:Uncharacterized protein n=1 Tax=Xylanimonas oleitrophica TaxID=2607479 RepID=A0A2W5Y291_9MICO|nr:hypothetical protein [Xylanimonas oleitrophica]PZR51664.1 hypothetical protein DNL40_15480 [Xylanimonas oleitrophica]
MNALAFRSADVLAALAQMDSDERTEWVALVKRAAANLSNAEYAWAGNAPDAQPDPDTWAANFFWLGTYQLAHALEQVTQEA